MDSQHHHLPFPGHGHLINGAHGGFGTASCGSKCCKVMGAQQLLRRMMQEEADKAGIPLYMPKLNLCTDNAAMIASAAYFRLMKGETAPLTLNAMPALRLV